MWRFGLFAFDPQARQLTRDGRPVPLEPQPTKALELFLSRPGELISRDELRAVIWGADTHVDFDRGLAYVLSQIRTALQDSGSNPRFLQTLPRQGYKFIAPVDRPLPPPPPASRRLWALAAIPIAVAGAYALWRTRPLRLAVSLFDNETGHPDLDRWVHALPDLVVAALTPLHPSKLAIIGNAAPLRQPRNIRRLKTLATELDADYILLGQLQNDAVGVRFITHLIRLPGETHLKANRLRGDLQHLPALESAVVTEFVRAVRQHVLQEPPQPSANQPLQS